MKKMKNRWRFSKLQIILIVAILLIIIPDNPIVAQMRQVSSYTLATKDSKTVKDQKEQILAVRLAMVARKPQLELYYKGAANDLIMDLNELLRKVIEVDYKTTTNDGDYLENIYNGYSVRVKHNSKETLYTYQFLYNETKEETDKVNKKIQKLLEELDIFSLSTYNKVKTIHDYIVNNTSYDTTGTRNTAYSALFYNTSQCQGYALLTYKMLMEAGVPTKIITGYGNGEAHAWNIVKIGKAWYNLDCTWDDPITSDGTDILVYDYFLKNETDFRNYTRDAQYRTTDFCEKYPMAQNSYVMK